MRMTADAPNLRRSISVRIGNFRTTIAMQGGRADRDDMPAFAARDRSEAPADR